MCTAIAYKADSFYFGRNLDYERGFGEQIVITPRNYEFNMRSGIKMESHYAMIGVATVMDGYPLYYDGLNEKGLCIAGLNFVGNAVYQDEKDGCSNIAQFEVIPWFLGRCSSVSQMRQLLKETNITKTQFADNLPAAQLHWIAADKEECIVIETTKDGMTVYDNPIGVLTNNPPFPIQLFSLNNYIKLSPKNPKIRAIFSWYWCYGFTGRFVLTISFYKSVICKKMFNMRGRLKCCKSVFPYAR